MREPVRAALLCATNDSWCQRDSQCDPSITRKSVSRASERTYREVWLHQRYLEERKSTSIGNMNAAGKAWFGLLLLAQASCAQQSSAEPEDVSEFIARRDVCDHLRGDIPDSSDADVVHRINDACRGTDADLSKLKSKYLANSSVNEKLAGYEPQIESQPQ